MKKKRVVALLVFLLVIGVVVRFWHRAAGPSSSGLSYVARVIDGDTAELSNGEIVRYIGIDTPELREKTAYGWVYNPMPYAELARDLNRSLTEGKAVRLEFDVQKRDRYKRLLAYVYAEGTMVNLEILRSGYALNYAYPPNLKYAEEFSKAQEEARSNRRGLWKGMEEGIIDSSGAKYNAGLIRIVETEVIDTYLSERALILNCRDSFKVVIFRRNFGYLPKLALRSPDAYFKHKTIRVYGLIKDYNSSYEIVVNEPSQLEIKNP